MATPSNNLRKAAVLLLSLHRRQRTQLLGRLEPRQTEAVTAEIDGLGEVDNLERDAVAGEFAGATRSPRTACRQAVAHGGEKKGFVPFQFLHELDSDRLLGLLEGEQPQTMALVLCHLPPRRAAAVLAELSPGQQLSVICRIAILKEPTPEVVADVENGLRRRLAASGGHPAHGRSLDGVVRMLHRMAPATERTLLGKLAEADPRLVRKIRRAMFGADVAACRPDMAETAG